MRVGGLRLSAQEWYSVTLSLPRRGRGADRVADLRAIACLGCGHIMLHAPDLAKLRALADEQPDRFGW